MKAIQYATCSASILCAGIQAALALEGPADITPPPAMTEATAADGPAVENPKQSGFLGAILADVTKELADHLALKPGEGVSVNAVMPDGPAATAGLQPHDIITKVDGKAAGSPQELTALIGDSAPGTKVTLDIIRKGDPANLDVTLGERPEQGVAAQPDAMDELPLDGVPPEFAKRLRRMIEGNVGRFDLQFNDAAGGIHDIAPQLENQIEQLKKQIGGLDQAEFPQLPDLPDAIQSKATSKIRVMDENGSVEIASTDGAKEVTVRDKDDKVVWTGPWDTDQDKAAAPDDVRKRVERFDSGEGGMKFNLFQKRNRD
jgi:membrane-associated protease RseP (regulator of RpoE activity)